MGEDAIQRLKNGGSIRGARGTRGKSCREGQKSQQQGGHADPREGREGVERDSARGQQNCERGVERDSAGGIRTAGVERVSASKQPAGRKWGVERDSARDETAVPEKKTYGGR